MDQEPADPFRVLIHRLPDHPALVIWDQAMQILQDIRKPGFGEHLAPQALRDQRVHEIAVFTVIQPAAVHQGFQKLPYAAGLCSDAGKHFFQEFRRIAVQRQECEQVCQLPAFLGNAVQ